MFRSKGSGEPRDPIVVVGMHRSGTSLVARLLREAGVYMGEDLDRHGESRAMRELNRFAMRVTHAEWDYPLPIRLLDEAPELRDELVAHLSEAMRSEALREAFLGEATGRSRGRRWPEPWGWKDPRSTLTLPLWRRVFPGLRAVHVVRNGIDVAASLVEREQERKKRLDHPARSLRCLDFDRAFALWTEYVSIAEEALATLPEAQALTVVYEELLQDPRQGIPRLLEFGGLSIAPDALDARVASIDGSRAFAFRKDRPEARPQQLDHELMRRLGYGPRA